MPRVDNFNRANASSLGTPSGGGSAWTASRASSEIISNTAKFTNASSGGVAYLADTLSDCDVQATWATGPANSGLAFRLFDADNMLLVAATGSGTTLQRLQGGGYTQIGSSAYVIQAGDVVRANLDGSAISVYVNNVLKIGPVTDSTFLANTNHGFWSYDDNTTRFDDFSIAAISAGDTTPPTVTARSIDAAGATLTVTFSESVTGGTGFTMSGYTLGTASGSGTTRTFSVTPTVTSGTSVTLDYAPGNVVDAASNALASFSGQSITNNSTQTPALSAGAATGSTTAVAASVAASAASGGTGTITYQWYGSTTSGFTPGAGNLLSGQTGQNLASFAVTAGTTWYFVRKATDSAGTPATAFTSQFTYNAPGSAGGGSTYSRGRLVNA